MIDAIERTFRRVQMMIGRGRVSIGNDAGSVQLQQLRFSDAEIQDNLPRVAEFGFTSMPPIGSDAVAVFLGGDRANGIIVATAHQASRPKGLQTGEAMIYSQDGKSVYLTAAGGIIVDAKGQDITVNNAGTATINASTKVILNTPELDVTGTIKAGGNIIDNSGSNSHGMAEMRTIYDSHTHSDPQGGSVSPPAPTM